MKTTMNSLTASEVTSASTLVTIMDDDGDLFYDYTNHRVGRMLISETKLDMDGDLDALDIIWEAEEEEEADGTDIF